MSGHIYAFGSICRGEVDRSSDVDLLALVNGFEDRFDPTVYSVYSYARIDELWEEGNPFAWHLHLESSLIYSKDGSDYLKNKTTPTRYEQGATDCRKFLEVFLSAKKSLEESDLAESFDLSSVFLSIRNFATCYSLANSPTPDFSRRSARNLGDNRVPLDDEEYGLFERARVLCTRGYGDLLGDAEIKRARSTLPVIESWMRALLNNEGKG